MAFWWTVTLKGVVDPFVRAAGPAVFHLEKRQVAAEVYNEDQRLEAVTALAADALGPC